MSGGINPADDFQHATLDEYIERKFRDQFFNGFGLLGMMERKVPTIRLSGGDNIVENLNVDENDQGGSYSGMDVFNNTPKETLDAAYFRFAKYQWPIVSSADEILRNKSSRGKIADLWMTKADITLKSMRNRLNTDLFADGSGNSSKNLTGMALMVDDAGTYGTIDRSAITVWQANETSVGGSLVVAGATGMVKMFNDCSLGSEEGNTIDILVTTQQIVEDYEALLDGQIRYMSTESADGGFGRLVFKGTPMMWDRAATSGILHYLTTSTFKYLIHEDREFITTEIQRAENGAQRDAYEANMLAWLQSVCLEPRRNGKLTGIS